MGRLPLQDPVAKLRATLTVSSMAATALSTTQGSELADYGGEGNQGTQTQAICTVGAAGEASSTTWQSAR